MKFEINVSELKEALDSGQEVTLVDVREGWEHAYVHFTGALHIPLEQLGERLQEIQSDRLHVIYCHHGIRSLNATVALAARGYNVRSLAGGIDRWAQEVDPTLPRY